MDIGIILGFIAFILIIAVLIIFGYYGSAAQAADRSQEYVHKISEVVDALHQTSQELDKLKDLSRPKSRPFLYTQIDQRINAAIQKATNEINTGVARGEKTTIDEVEAPASNLFALVDVLGNKKKADIQSANEKKFEAVNARLVEAQKQIGEIQSAIAAEKALNDGIERDLQGVLREIAERDAELNSIKTKVGELDYLGVQAIRSFLQEQTDGALKALRATEKEDGIHYGRASALLAGLRHLLDLYDLKRKMLNVPPNYELDVSNPQTFRMITKIQEITSKIPALDFGTLTSSANDLAKEKENVTTAIEVFEQFHAERDTYEARHRQVCALELDKLLQRATTAESALDAYWGSPTESPSIWAPLLPKKELPSKRLSLISDAQKKACRGETLNIKQSELSRAISGFDSVLAHVKEMEKIVNDIQGKADENKRAETLVQQKISQNGSSMLAYRNIFSLMDEKKCPPNVEKEIQGLEEEFIDLRSRASTRKKADFPDILNKLAEFESNAKAVRAQYDREIAKKKESLRAHSREIAGLRSQFESLKGRFPTEDWEWKKLTDVFGGIQDQYAEIDDHYPKMIEYERSAKEMILWLTAEKDLIRSRIDELSSERNDLKASLHTDKATYTNRAQEVLNTQWQGPFRKQLDELKTLLGKYEELSKKLDGATSGPLLHIPGHLSEARNRLSQLNQKISEAIDEIRPKVKGLNTKLNILEARMSLTGKDELSPVKRAEIETWIERAKGATNVEVAEYFLTEAFRKLE